MKRTFVFLGIATSVGAAYLVSRAKELAQDEERSLIDVLTELPGRIVNDLSTLPDDIREAAEEGQRAADRAAAEFDEEMGTG